MIDQQLSKAAARWPRLSISLDTFRDYVLARARRADEVAQLKLDDLYLACGCALGDERAIAAFRRAYGPAVRHAVTQAVPLSLADDAEQQVLLKLFVAAPNRRAAITTYNGRGKLSTWVQVVARRAASNALRGERRAKPSPAREAELLLQHTATDRDLITAGIKRDCREAFRRAFATALESLSPRERNLLRYECIEGLTIEQTAHLYGVSPSTIARWRARCRARLFRRTRDTFCAEASADDFDSVLVLVESRLDVSLSRLLGPAGESVHADATMAACPAAF